LATNLRRIPVKAAAPLPPSGGWGTARALLLGQACPAHAAAVAPRPASAWTKGVRLARNAIAAKEREIAEGRLTGAGSLY